MADHPNGVGEWFRALLGKKEKDDTYYNRRPASGLSGVRSHMRLPQKEEAPLPEKRDEPIPARAFSAPEPEAPAAEPVVNAPAPVAAEPEPDKPAAQISLDLPEDVVGKYWPHEVTAVARDPEDWEEEAEEAAPAHPSEGQVALDLPEAEPAPAPEPVAVAPKPEPEPVPAAPAPMSREALETPRAPIPSSMNAHAPQAPRDLPREADAADFEEEEPLPTAKPRHNRAVGCLTFILILLLLLGGLGYGLYYYYPKDVTRLYHTYIAPLPPTPAPTVPLVTPEPIVTREAFLVSWGDIPLGTVEDASALLEQYAKWREGLETATGMTLTQPSLLTVTPVTVEDGYTFTEADTILKEARNRTDRSFNGCVVMIEGHDLFAMASPEKFRGVIESILDEAKAAALKTLATEENPEPEMPPCEWSFAETMRVERRTVTALDILTETEAKERLQAKTSSAQTTYTIQSGDTLAKIATRFHTTQEALLEANPELESPDVIKVGETLRLRGETQTLNLVLTLTLTEVKTIPFTAEKVNDGDMAKGTSKVVQEGEDGQETTVSRDAFLNGELVSHKVLSVTTDKEMVPEITHVGTYVKDTGSNPGGRKFPYPVSGYRISSPFGWRESTQSYHKGIDLAVPIGTPIYAADSGTVAFSGNASGYGLVVYINHSGGYQTRYGHCSRLVVKSGDTVKKGQLIAYSGNTGKSSGPHCHFEIRVNGNAVDPKKYQ